MMPVGPGRAAPSRILCLGDSYTVGEGVEPEGTWPAQLAELLQQRGRRVVAPQIIAETGWTTGELAAALAAADLRPPYDLVTLMIGVNDQYRGYPLADTRAGLARLVDRAVGLAGGGGERLIVLSVPDYGVTPFAADRDRTATGAAIDELNRACAEEAGRAGARYLDVTPSSRCMGDDSALVAGDGLHPSAKMYAAWARMMLPVAAAVLDSGQA